MRYMMSDIHGCYEEYRELLEKIGFDHDDELYVLGDAMDRGPEPIRVIRDLMRRPMRRWRTENLWFIGTTAISQ